MPFGFGIISVIRGPSVLPPIVSAVDKSLGDYSGGTVLTITVNDSTGCVSGTCCGVALTSFSIIDGVTVQGTTGLMTPSATLGDVTVSGPGGTGTLSSAFEAFAPTNITGCVAWFRADLGVTTSSSHVTQWNDGSSSAANITGSGTWTVASSWTNGKPALFTDNTTSLKNTTTNIITAGAARSVFAVLDSTDLAGGGTGGGIFTFRLGGFVCTFMNLWVGVTVIYRDGVVTNLTCSGDPAADFATPVGVDFEYGGTGTAPVYNIGGVAQTGIGTSTNDDNGTTGFEVGGNSASAQFWNGNIGEIAAHDHAYSGPELARLVAYRKDRYGLSA